MNSTEYDRQNNHNAEPLEGMEREDVMLTDYFNRRHYSKPDVEAQLVAFKARHGMDRKRPSRGVIMAIMAAGARSKSL